MTATTYGATASTMPRQKRATRRRPAPGRVRVAAELDGQQVDARVEPDDELAALARDRVGEPVGEGGGRAPASLAASSPPAPSLGGAQACSRGAEDAPDGSGGAVRGEDAAARAGRRAARAAGGAGTARRSSSSSASSGSSDGSARTAPRQGPPRPRPPRRRPGGSGRTAATRPPRDEVGAHEARARPRDDERRARARAAGRARQLARRRLERGDAVAQPRRVLVAQALGEDRRGGARRRGSGPPSAGARARLGRAASARAAQLGAPPRAERAPLAGLATRPRRRRRGGAARRRVRPRPRAFAGGCSSRIRRSSASAASSSEPSTRHSIRSSAPSAASTAGRWRSVAEVRAQPRAQVAGAADVEHAVVRVAEEVDARPRRRARGERALARARAAPAAWRARRRPPTVVAPRSCARPSRRDEDLGGRLARRAARGGTAASAVPKKCASAARPTRASLRPRAGGARARPCRRPARRARRPVSRSTSRSRKREVEAGVVRDEHRVAGEGEEAAHGRARPAARRGARARVSPVSAPIAAGSGTPRVDERLERRRRARASRTRTAPISQMRVAARRRARSSRGRRRRTSRRSSGERVARRTPARPTRRAAPGEPRVAVDDVRRAARAPGPPGSVAQREQPPRRLLGRQRPAPLLDELDQPVGRVERAAARRARYANICSYCKLGRRRGPPRGGPPSLRRQALR